MHSTEEESRGDLAQRLSLEALELISQDGTTHPLVGLSAGLTMLVAMAHAMSMDRETLVGLVRSSFDIVDQMQEESASGVKH